VVITPPIKPEFDILPRYEAFEGESNRTLLLTLDSSPGDRYEIGLFTEWASECIATGRACDHVIAQADHLLDAPWCDLIGIYKRKWAGGDYGLSFAHTPNTFFLPYLLTGDPKYIKPMECQWKTKQELSYRGIDEPLKWLSGRELAWVIRNLGELAYLEREGLIADSALSDPDMPYRDPGKKLQVSIDKQSANPNPKLYQEALEATRLRIIERITPSQEEFRSLSWSANGFNAWMEAFIGMTINHLIQLGFDEWRPLAGWHFQHLAKRCGGEWSMKYCSNDYVKDLEGKTWAEAQAFTPLRMEAIADYADDKMTPDIFNGQRLTYGIRRSYLLAWAKMARQNNIPGAAEFVQKVQPLIAEMGDKVYHKTNFQ